VDGSNSARESTSSDIWVRDNGVWLVKQFVGLAAREILPPVDPATASRVAAELKKHVVPLATAEARNAYADLEAFGKAVGEARIVSLGEATHGTREIFQMKHRLLEYLV
jgi:erythromycin esterase